MEELMKLIEDYEIKTSSRLVSVTVFSDGSGYVEDYDGEVFSFNNEQQMKESFNSFINK